MTVDGYAIKSRMKLHESPEVDIRSDLTAARTFAPLLIGMAMTIVDIPMMAIAMPGIGADLGLGTGALALIAGAYPLVVAMLLLPAGRAGDRFGRRRVFLAGGLLFMTGAMLSALAPGAAALAGARMVQAIGAATLAPQALAMIPRIFAPASQTGAFARLAMTGSVASVCGPLLAGALLGTAPGWLGWRAIFLAEVALAVLVMGLAARRLAADDVAVHGTGRPAEIASFAAIILCLVAPLSLSPAFGWPMPVFPPAGRRPAMRCHIRQAVGTCRDRGVRPARASARAEFPLDPRLPSSGSLGTTRLLCRPVAGAAERAGSQPAADGAGHGGLPGRRGGRIMGGRTAYGVPAGAGCHRGLTALRQLHADPGDTAGAESRAPLAAAGRNAGGWCGDGFDGHLGHATRHV